MKTILYIYLVIIVIALSSCTIETKDEYTLDSLANDTKAYLHSDQKRINNRVSESVHQFDDMDILIITTTNGVHTRNLTLEKLQVEKLKKENP